VSRVRENRMPGSMRRREESGTSNVLEWRLDPACAHCDSDLARREARIALICNEGYQSSLAAATVARFGLAEVTDVIGGFQAWRAAGLPVERSESRPARAGK
jgi:rhodanese-related sulfurtransferase